MGIDKNKTGAKKTGAKKRAGRLSPAPQIVSTLFSAIGFDLDWRSDAA
jgi:hypothetical protein